MRGSSDLDSTTLSALGTAALRIKSGLGWRSLGDPAAWSYASGLSLYEAEYSNPIDFTDPSGLAAPNCVGNNLRNCQKSHGKWDSLANNLYAGSQIACVNACLANYWVHLLGGVWTVGGAVGGAIGGGPVGAGIGGGVGYYGNDGFCQLSCAAGGCSTSQTPW
jgi:hypothetical protein